MFPVEDSDQWPPPVVERSPFLAGEPFSFRFVCVGLELDLQVSDTGLVWYTVGTLPVEQGGEYDAGEIQVDAAKVEAAMEDPLALAFAGGALTDDQFERLSTPGSNCRERLSRAVGMAGKTNKKLLVVVGDPDGTLCQDLARWLREDRTVTEAFRIVALRVSRPFHYDAHAFVPWIDVSYADAQRLVLAVASPDGQLLDRWKAAELTSGEHLDPTKVRVLLERHREK
ncbi:MAG: hypothetical protein K2Y37_27130 [Pirellulales bacterium]|nr:hypothetical protein [Pirellulales bacterium]